MFEWSRGRAYNMLTFYPVESPSHWSLNIGFAIFGSIYYFSGRHNGREGHSNFRILHDLCSSSETSSAWRHMELITCGLTKEQVFLALNNHRDCLLKIQWLGFSSPWAEEPISAATSPTNPQWLPSRNLYIWMKLVFLQHFFFLLAYALENKIISRYVKSGLCPC